MGNPLLESPETWEAPFGLPPFARIETAHFAPAFEAAMGGHRAEVEAVATDPAPADFANTLEAMERAGRALERVSAVFHNLCVAHTDAALQAVERAMAPKLAAHRSAILMDPRLLARVEAVAGQALDPEPARVAELYRRMFVKAGAQLEGAARARMAEIMQRLAELGTAFGQNVLADERDWALILGRDELAGLPAFLVEAAAREAQARGHEGEYAITLARSSVEPFLAFSARRDLRERAWRAWASRGEASNWPLVEEIVRLRAERARLLGFASFAELRLHDQMARTPGRVRALLDAVWGPAQRRAGEEAGALEALAAGEGADIALAPWDWRYYAEKLRQRRHRTGEGEVEPYLALDNVIAAAFDVAGRLFGLSFRAVEGLALHHPDARAWEVAGPDGRHLGLFIGDYFARPSKRSGAWASGFRRQQKLWEPGRPVVVNTLNIAPGDPPLLGWDDARTLFHEFGHALHALMSDVTYPLIAGTSVERDFVELPSQLFEHWLMVPEILAAHARHHRSGAPMPGDLIERLKTAETFNQGFATVEYLASARVDLEMHALEAPDAPDAPDGFDARAFEAGVLARIGMPTAIAMRHRTPHFQHVFAGGGYAAGYYSYLWADVLVADAWRAFAEAGDPFDAATAAALAAQILSAGGRQEPEDAYTAFRGRLPGVGPLLEERGLAQTSA
ncbi:MAG TPA: M3 family metallopeptidase [Thermohalobaculum sp.]|nr:M3 family metallopeptidase [Thermohalobaculum sp.]